MKNLNYLNYFFVGLPIVFCLIATINIGFLSFAMLSTILTGLFQVVIGTKMIIDEPQDRNLQIYIISVVLFFSALIIISKMELHNFLNYFLFGVPPVIAIFLSVIIYKKATK
ncbi:MAG: hypothetical protein ABI441_18885 [Flavobacterium sp.]